MKHGATPNCAIIPGPPGYMKVVAKCAAQRFKGVQTGFFIGVFYPTIVNIKNRKTYYTETNALLPNGIFACAPSFNCQYFLAVVYTAPCPSPTGPPSLPPSGRGRRRRSRTWTWTPSRTGPLAVRTSSTHTASTAAVQLAPRDRNAFMTCHQIRVAKVNSSPPHFQTIMQDFICSNFYCR